MIKIVNTFESKFDEDQIRVLETYRAEFFEREIKEVRKGKYNHYFLYYAMVDINTLDELYKLAEELEVFFEVNWMKRNVMICEEVY